MQHLIKGCSCGAEAIEAIQNVPEPHEMDCDGKCANCGEFAWDCFGRSNPEGETKCGAAAMESPAERRAALLAEIEAGR
jgi:hypothetical protein